MKKVLLVLALISFAFWGQMSACNSSTISIASTTDNPDGTTTYTLDLLIELGGLDLDYYGFILLFNSSQNTPTVTNSTPTTINPTMGLNEPLIGVTGAAINTYATDSDFGAYTGVANAMSYEYDYVLFGNAANDDFNVTVNITVDGCVEEIEFLSHPNSGAANCIKTASTGLDCSVCDITNVALGTQTSCVPATNNYTQQVIVSYTNPPSTGTLDVNGQSFAITTSPQTVTLTGLTADGNAVNGTVEFSADTDCDNTVSFTAPASCTVGCAADNGIWD